MDFQRALTLLKNGEKILRNGWNGKGMWVAIKSAPAPDLRVVYEYPTMTAPFIFMKTADGQFVPWLASQTDILADDWLMLCNDPPPKEGE